MIYRPVSNTYMVYKIEFYSTAAAGAQGVDVDVSDLPRSQVLQLDWSNYFLKKGHPDYQHAESIYTDEIIADTDNIAPSDEE